MNEDNETTNETKQNKRLKKQDKNNSPKHHEQVQRMNKTDLLDQVSSRQEQIYGTTTQVFVPLTSRLI